MPTLYFDGAEIAYLDEGAGTPVVLLHASSSTGGQWRTLAYDLARDHRVIVPDRQGYGRSGPLTDGIDHLFAHESATVSTLLERVGGGPAHLVGHSSGGVVALRAALAAPRMVASLTLIEPVLFHLAAGDAPGIAEAMAVADAVIEADAAGCPNIAARPFIDYWNGADAWIHLPDRLRGYIVGTMPRVAAEFRTMRRTGWPAAEDIRRLAMPVLLLQGGATTDAAASVMGRLRTLLPHATYASLGHLGHMAPATDPEAVNPFVAGFLRSLPAVCPAGRLPLAA